VGNRLFQDSTDTTENVRFINGLLVRVDRYAIVNGIIARLYSEHQGNVHTLRIAQVSVSRAASEHRNVVGYANPKSWMIKRSNDGITWTEINQRDANSKLNARSAISTFRLAESGSEGKRRRLRGTTFCADLRLRISVLSCLNHDKQFYALQMASDLDFAVAFENHRFVRRP
jgi:hypothetical protein